MCKTCGLVPAYWKNGTCRQCGGCQNCMRNEWASEKTKLCKNCECSECHLANAGWKDNDLRYCIKCFVAKFPEKMCMHCKRDRATVLSSYDRTKPRMCQRCASTVKNLRCWWCDSPTRGSLRDMPKNIVACCNICSRTRCCFKGKCVPSNPCSKCRVPPHHEVGGDFYFTQEPKFYYALAISHRRRNRNPRLLSPEIECAGLRYAAIAHGNAEFMAKYGKCICTSCYAVRLQEIHALVKTIGGSIVTDDSLGEGGFEINMPPSGGDFFLDNVQKVSDLLSNSLAYVTPNCGTHIHIDARDLDHGAMRRFLLAYARVEDALVATQPIARIQGHHSVPCKQKYMNPEMLKLPSAIDTTDWSKKLRHSLADAVFVKEYDRPPRLLRGDHREINARYDAMNVQSWYYRGTLECRLHSGTIDAQKIQQWGMLLAGLVDASINMKEADILALSPETPKENLIRLTPSRVHEYLQNRWAAFELQHRRK